MLFNTMCVCDSQIRFATAAVNAECPNCGHSNNFAESFRFFPFVTVEDQYSRAQFKCNLALKFRKIALSYFTHNRYHDPAVFFEALKSSREVY